MNNDYPVINPKEWRLWLILAPYFAACVLGLAKTDTALGYFVFGLATVAGVVGYFIRPDSPLRRLRVKRSILATTWQGAYVRGVGAPADILTKLAALGIEAATEDYPSAADAEARIRIFKGQFIDFQPGPLGGPQSPAGHVVHGAYVQQNDTITVEYNPGDNEQTVLDRVRYGALILLDSRLRRPGTYHEHRAYLESVGVDLRGVPL
jgi:hypothetical protein